MLVFIKFLAWLQIDEFIRFHYFRLNTMRFMRELLYLERKFIDIPHRCIILHYTFNELTCLECALIKSILTVIYYASIKLRMALRLHKFISPAAKTHISQLVISLDRV